MKKLVRTAATGLAVLAFLIFTVASGVLLVSRDEAFYLDEFATYRVSETTQLSQEELVRVARVFISYLSSPDAFHPLDIAVTRDGREVALFNERELRHMADVHALMQGVAHAWRLALIGLLLGALGIAAAHPPSAAAALLRTGGLAGAATLAAVGVAALGSLVDFGTLFLQFHYLSFSNDLWMLDPRRDRLIQLFPLGFFFDAALRVAIEVAAAGAVVAMGSLVGLRLLRR